MSFRLIRVLFALIVFIAISCKCTKYGCEVPCASNGKTVKYVLGAYYNVEGKLTYKLFVTDSMYTARAKADFEAFKGAIISKGIKPNYQ